MDAVALLGGNEYLVQQLLDRLLDAGFTTAQVKMDITQNRLKGLEYVSFNTIFNTYVDCQFCQFSRMSLTQSDRFQKIP